MNDKAQEIFPLPTKAEAERLAMLAEECGEIIQVVGKILRNGYDSYHPDRPEITNRRLLANEIIDVVVVLDLMQCEVNKDAEAITKAEYEKVVSRKLRFSRYQGEIE